MNHHYELIIIGGGPAAITAAIYAARKHIDFIMINSEPEIGGQIVKASLIENIPGIPSITGEQLVQNYKQQLIELDVNIKHETVKAINKNKYYKDMRIVGYYETGGTLLYTTVTDNNTYYSHNVIVATGMTKIMPDIPGINDLIGRGISTCTTCDAMFCKDKDVVVIGSGNSAAGAALELAYIASNVKIVIRSKKMKCDDITLDKLNSLDNVEIVNNSNIVEINKTMKGLKYKLNDEYYDCKMIFVEIGSKPNTKCLLDGNIELRDEPGISVGYYMDDKDGFIKVYTGEDRFTPNKITMQTCHPGLYVCGDIVSGFPKQVSIACGHATTAVLDIYKKLNNN